MTCEAKDVSGSQEDLPEMTTLDFSLGKKDAITVADSVVGSEYRLRLLNISPVVVRYSDKVNDPNEERGIDVTMRLGRFFGKPSRYGVAPCRGAEEGTIRFMVTVNEGVTVKMDQD